MKINTPATIKDKSCGYTAIRIPATINIIPNNIITSFNDGMIYRGYKNLGRRKSYAGIEPSTNFNLYIIGKLVLGQIQPETYERLRSVSLGFI